MLIGLFTGSQLLRVINLFRIFQRTHNPLELLSQQGIIVLSCESRRVCYYNFCQVYQTFCVVLAHCVLSDIVWRDYTCHTPGQLCSVLDQYSGNTRLLSKWGILMFNWSQFSAISINIRPEESWKSSWLWRCVCCQKNIFETLQNLFIHLKHTHTLISRSCENFIDLFSYSWQIICQKIFQH